MLLQILLFFKFTEARESSNLAYYQKVVAAKNLTGVEIGKSYRLRVGDSVIITLPRAKFETWKKLKVNILTKLFFFENSIEVF